MRTLSAFLFGALVVAGLWYVRESPAGGHHGLRPAIDGPAVVTGLGEPVQDFAFGTVDGEVAMLSDLLAQGPVVVAIRDAACPVSQRYGPTMVELEDRLAPLGVQFLYVNVAQRDPDAVRSAEVERFGLQGRYVLDVSGAVRRALDPRTTTEVFVIDTDGVLRYRGAVDDQHGYDFARPRSSRDHLNDAVEAVLAGDPPPVAATFASGCYLTPVAPTRTASADLGPTYHGEVQQILQQSCEACHREGGIGPVSLTSYEAVLEHRDRIRTMVNRDRMPPWPAGETRRWANDRRLSESQKLVVLQWLSAGAPKGDPSLAPPPREWAGGWLHGMPDAVLEVPEPFEVPPDAERRVETFLIPTDFGEDRWVSRIEILPSAPGSVLHAVAILAEPPVELEPQADIAEGLAGFFAAWAPGYDGNVFPEGTGKRIPAGSWIKLHVQYVPTGEQVLDQTRIGLHFTDGPPAFEVETRSAYTTGFVIPAGASNHAVSAEYRFPDGGQILSFSPHMLHRGAALRYVLWRPDGTQETLLDIPRYYPAFRTSYVPAEPIPVEPGAVLKVTGWFDNSEANPRNPDPSSAVSAGIRPSQEILLGYFDFAPGAQTLPGPTLAQAGDREPIP